MTILRVVFLYVFFFALVFFALLLLPYKQNEEHAVNLQWATTVSELGKNSVNRTANLRAFQYRNRFGYIHPETGRGFSLSTQNLVAQSDQLFAQKETTENTYLLFDSTGAFIQAIPIKGELIIHNDEVALVSEDYHSIYQIHDRVIVKTEFGNAVVSSIFSSENIVAYLFSLGLVDLSSDQVLFTPDSMVIDYKNSGAMTTVLRIYEEDISSSVVEIYAINRQEEQQLKLSRVIASSPVHIETNDSHSLIAFANIAQFYLGDVVAQEYTYNGMVEKVFASDEIFAILVRNSKGQSQISIYSADAQFIAGLSLSATDEVISVFDNSILFGTQYTLLLVSL